MYKFRYTACLRVVTQVSTQAHNVFPVFDTQTWSYGMPKCRRKRPKSLLKRILPFSSLIRRFYRWCLIAFIWSLFHVKNWSYGMPKCCTKRIVLLTWLDIAIESCYAWIPIILWVTLVWSFPPAGVWSLFYQSTNISICPTYCLLPSKASFPVIFIPFIFVPFIFVPFILVSFYSFNSSYSFDSYNIILISFSLIQHDNSIITNRFVPVYSVWRWRHSDIKHHHRDTTPNLG